MRAERVEVRLEVSVAALCCSLPVGTCARRVVIARFSIRFAIRAADETQSHFRTRSHTRTTPRALNKTQLLIRPPIL